MDLKGRRTRDFFVDYLMLNIGWLMFNVMRFFMLPMLASSHLVRFLLLPSLKLEQLLVPVFMMALFAVSGVYNSSAEFFRSRIDRVTNTALVVLAGAICIYFGILANDDIPERATTFELMGTMWI
ncbi:MAG: hypothetical protein K2F63_04640, partial [Muribaculaceae bacterium]|nr:hypothetical protein [Muribaculaceae bacterium]